MPAIMARKDASSVRVVWVGVAGEAGTGEEEEDIFESDWDVPSQWSQHAGRPGPELWPGVTWAGLAGLGIHLPD
jgi:hypothetical protein